MALREIRIFGDPILNKNCREVKEITPRIRELIEDMYDTMYEANGVGLAAPQVGVVRRICVIDVGDGNQYTLINPEIVTAEGEQTGDEGCLSFPGKAGQVTRPNHVVVKCLNEEFEEITIEGEGLLARAMCHEIDHLSGHLYTEKVEGAIHDVNYDDDSEEEE